MLNILVVLTSVYVKCQQIRVYNQNNSLWTISLCQTHAIATDRFQCNSTTKEVTPSAHTEQQQHTTLYAEKNWAARVGTALRRKKFTNYYNFFPPNANSPIWPSTRPKLNTGQHSELKFTGVGGHICGKKPQKVNCSDFSPTHLCGLHGHSPSKQMRLPLHFPGVSLPAHELISDCRSL